MEIHSESLNQIEARFRNYILLLDFILRETRNELSENRTKREIWLEQHRDWKKNRLQAAEFRPVKIQIQSTHKSCAQVESEKSTCIP
ncbi:hypothetical protein EHQ13_07295 [Leptospira gomenensis]|uniref:Uncharacterized protein n=1 Tax=Leptospira gomenensis TaxID=2484974 RepID=A0A5F1Y7R3_9LEPT|nr:hypothetical protein [Leptospira gomenensis]TGK29488.1 hypothetical protein EHQ17_16075 [Leptospira gomenensis]TGK44850.1 hypothetical protein EHQ07_11215 [Leptospira gomenensis]TGK64469.1 hypothetical protein EHQ13_07295 [Leptospira gomenensis]